MREESKNQNVVSTTSLEDEEMDDDLYKKYFENKYKVSLNISKNTKKPKEITGIMSDILKWAIL